MSTPQSRSGTSTPNIEQASGYLLLTIEHALVKQETMVLARGQMRLECVSLPIPAKIGRQTANPFAPSPSDPPVPTHDFWLVIHIGATFEMPLVPDEMLTPQVDKDGGICYRVASPSVPDASLLITLPRPSSLADMEDLESFEVLLRQYRCLGAEVTALSNIVLPKPGQGQASSSTSSTPSNLAPEEMRGKLVIVNEDNGEIIGEMDQQLDLEEDRRLAHTDKNKPVMLDFGHVLEGSEALSVKVKTVPQAELDDPLLRGAHNISRSILSFGAWSSRQMMSGADHYIRNSTPRAEPVHFSPETKEGFMKAHRATVKTATVTKSTIGKIQGAISTVAEKTYTHGIQPAVDTYRRNSEPPPIPPRMPRNRAPPIPAKPTHLAQSPDSQRPPVPPRLTSPAQKGHHVPIPSHTETLLAETDNYNAPPSFSDHAVLENDSYYESPSSSRPQTPGTAPAPPKRKLLSRLLLAGEVVLTSLEATAHDMINNGTLAAHKYGPDAGEATALVGGSVKNVAVVYIDVAGVGRRALLKSTAKGFVKARLNDGETIKLQAEGSGNVKAGEVEKEEGEIVVGMQEIGKSSAVENRSSEKSGLTRR
ncbi:hypothetical protein IAR55_001716 [Kwoniella newhampshirensis]|uniref:Senescence domain-containing protein n=1 Tax=Kwoniella newhampshirensis TaxID=1651941 RepID=A0AAW0Z2Y1_9TREE